MKSDSLEVVVRKASLEELFWVHMRIPEFGGRGDLDFYRKRLEDKRQLSLVAVVEDELIGFKVGYQSDKPKVFYSWMGGIIPEFRRGGVATALAEYQEDWARNNGFEEIFFKTRNRLPPMINFGLQREFKIVEVIRKGTVDDYRIVMMKRL
ncbi:putative GNAT superfamily acetyltransferase [Algoriphagus sp. 4150]|uniref:GNAT family N-acetyltransferase n=1 Tax=Algoriphagus sp. 4150 TaxID=2817756 RepID=UPI00285D41A1|nr:GNAT family N-acetyltransferase [Algoriphagus sp. 4150]MDR7130462.1 putative GNAT superfamily acetyltransferase [Algoriphagus sp. 4150]